MDINLCLSIPLTNIYKDWQNSDTVSYLKNPTAQRSFVHDFFKPNPNGTTLEFQTRQECKSPTILSKLKRYHRNGQLTMQDFFKKLIQPSESTTVHQQEVTAHLRQYFRHNNEAVWLNKNRSIRQLLLKQLPLQLPTD
ncbi:hypothetical protein V8B55DRAFT_1576904 [Mucor lusitanicus]|uniref:Uncharacterized protein n=1 Tax=Mucor lusitanicus CBS 277.49 TaxID=747725 RepID=A0A168L5Z1_MUCCL|nr:hypothetical protein MUCCIDRAFT_109999 [Mucor lusitanicus CBS 277.49]